MTTTQLIAVFGISLSAVIALLVSHLQRKQMRQIELYKNDPSVGLTPPESTLTKFIKSKWDSIFAYGGPIYILASQMLKDEPISRFDIFIISFSMMMLSINVSLALVLRVQSRLLERIEQLQEFNDKQLSLTGKIIDVIYQPGPPST